MKAVRKKQNGFTLIEMLVVIVIIGVIMTMALIAFSALNSNRAVKMTAQHLERVVMQAKQQAVLMPEILGLVVNKQGYQFYVFHHDSKGKFKFEKLKNDILSKPEAFSRNVDETMVKLGENTSGISLSHQKVKMIFFSDSGDVTPFTLDISDKKHSVLYQLKMNEKGVQSLKNITGQSP